MLNWLWIGVKEIALGLWVLTLLGLATLAVWRSLARFLHGEKGKGPYDNSPGSWFAVLGWVGVLTTWTLATYLWVEVFRINMILWALTLLHFALEFYPVHLR